MRVELLGPVRIHAGDTTAEVGPAQRCLLLAALAVDVGRLVSRETLVDRVWGKAPPAAAWRTAQTHVAHIRGLLSRVGVPAGRVLRVHRGGGYLLDVDPDAVDVHRFRRLATTVARDDGLVDAARLAVRRASLTLWRGEPLSGLAGPWVERMRATWFGWYRDAALDWADAEIRAGDPTAVLDPLTELITRYPLVEALPAMLMRALCAAGRRSEALEVYAAARRRLDEELAELPGPDLRAAYRAALRHESDPSPAGSVTQGALVPPAQLPADVFGFVGRVDYLRELDSIADTIGNQDDATAVVVSAIAGTAGVGKTALAVHWAHRAAKRFPDGQLYVNLHGFDADEKVVQPSTVLRRFLGALGTSPDRIPADPDAQAALYRTLLADKRMLILLDNAHDTAQVRPLLPGTPGCLVLITSRSWLAGLIATPGARPLRLDLLTTTEARDLLTRRLGRQRVNAEPDAIDILLTRCAGLPLALALLAARAATHAHLPLASLAAQLHDTETRLDQLAGDDPITDLRAVFSWSYITLTPPAQRLFRLLGLQPGPDISTAATASLAALSALQVLPLLAELTSANLIVEHRPGRYTFHDLLRVYATDLAHRTETAEQRHAATLRVLDHYLHTACTADLMLGPGHQPIALGPPQPGTVPQHPASYQQALEWFIAEHGNLLAVVHLAAATDRDTHVWRSTLFLTRYLETRGHWHDWVNVALAAVSATDRLADHAIQGEAHRLLAKAYIRLSRHEEAQTHLDQAFDHALQTGDHACKARVHLTLGQLAERLGCYTEAIHHTEHVLDLFTRVRDQTGIAQALNNAAWLHAHLNNHQQALEYAQQALTLSEAIGDDDGQAHTWDSLGLIHHHLGNHTKAITCYHNAMARYRYRGPQYVLSITLDHLGDAHHATSNQHAAEIAWQQALAILDSLRHPDADTLRAKISKHQGTGDRPTLAPH